jgi:hypothetical protein
MQVYITLETKKNAPKWRKSEGHGILANKMAMGVSISKKQVSNLLLC